MKLGVIVKMSKNISEEMKKVREMGFDTCQLVCWNMEMLTDDYAEQVNNAVRECKIEITAFWCGWQGPAEWNFTEGPATLGLVPAEYRFIRAKNLIEGSGFAKKINVKDIVTHVGFIPENPKDSDYTGLICILKYIIEHLKKNGQRFLFETGQETPVTIKRIIDDVGYDNVGVNLDPANLLMYGKANPVDALDILGPYVYGVHAKDGEYPSCGIQLGVEKPLGKGRVNFPQLISKLKYFNYNGAITIEREISGEQQIKDIMQAKEYLEKIINGKDI